MYDDFSKKSIIQEIIKNLTLTLIIFLAPIFLMFSGINVPWIMIFTIYIVSNVVMSGIVIILMWIFLSK